VSGPKRILVADDDPLVRRPAREILAGAELPRIRFMGKPFEKGALLDLVVSGAGDLKAVECE
jgi:hypothetical protein